MSNLQSIHKNRVLLQYQKGLAALPVKEFAHRFQSGAVKQYLEKVDGEYASKPEDDAIWFYMMNHAMALISQKYMAFEPLGPAADIVNEYHQKCAGKTVRMFYYLVLICLREARHGGSRAKLHAKYPKLKNLHENVADSTSIGNVFLNYCPPDVKMGEFTEFLVDAFKLCTYSGGFGGKAWAEVAHPLNEFVQGRITAEMMMDTAYTLAHNNGPIFNKGMLFQMYNAGEILKILDVQRAGMIPQLVASNASPFVSPKHKKFQQKVEALVGPAFGGAVDWAMVKKLGAKGDYSHLYSGDSTPITSSPQSKIEQFKAKQAAEKAEKAKAEAAKAAAAEKAAFQKHHFEVMPGAYVKKISRKEAA